jgi:hypothetical protein
MTRCDADRERGKTRERETFGSVAPGAKCLRSRPCHLRVLPRCHALLRVLVQAPDCDRLKDELILRFLYGPAAPARCVPRSLPKHPAGLTQVRCVAIVLFSVMSPSSQ